MSNSCKEFKILQEVYSIKIFTITSLDATDRKYVRLFHGYEDFSEQLRLNPN